MAGKGNANRRTGAFWERQAAEYLEQKGYQILERNWKHPFGELDLIARKDRVVAGLVALSFAASYAAGRLPVVSGLSGGSRTILLTLLLAGGAAALFPVREEGEDHE